MLPPSDLVNILVAARKGDRLKRDRLNFVDVLNCKIDDIANVVVDAIDDRVDERHFHSDARHVFDRLKLDIKQISDTTMLVLFLSRTIKLQVCAVQSGFFRLSNKVRILSEADAVGRREYAVESDFFRVADCVQEIWRQRRLAAGEQNDDLPARLE